MPCHLRFLRVSLRALRAASSRGDTGVSLPPSGRKRGAFRRSRASNERRNVLTAGVGAGGIATYDPSRSVIIPLTHTPGGAHAGALAFWCNSIFLAFLCNSYHFMCNSIHSIHSIHLVQFAGALAFLCNLSWLSSPFLL